MKFHGFFYQLLNLFLSTARLLEILLFKFKRLVQITIIDSFVAVGKPSILSHDLKLSVNLFEHSYMYL